MENLSLALSSLEREASCETTPPERLEQLANINPELAKQVARNPFAPVEILRQLSQSEDLETRKAVAANPNAPTDVLLDLGAKFPEQLVENPVFMLLMLESPDFLHKMSVRAILNLLECDKTPMFVFEQVANHFPGLHENLLDNPRTPVSVFEKLARNKHFLIRLLVARSPRTPVSVLEQLASDSHHGVLLAVAKNPKTPVSVLKKLASDRAETIRRVVAKNPRTPTEIREQLNLDKAR